jgi:hypothetical protein
LLSGLRSARLVEHIVDRCRDDGPLVPQVALKGDPSFAVIDSGSL